MPVPCYIFGKVISQPFFSCKIDLVSHHRKDRHRAREEKKREKRKNKKIIYNIPVVKLENYTKQNSCSIR